MRDAKSARCGFHDLEANDVPNLMQMLNTASPVSAEARQRNYFEANSIFEISDTLNDDEPMSGFIENKNESGEEIDVFNQKAFVEELGLDIKSDDLEHLNELSIVDMWDVVSLQLADPVPSYRRSYEPERRYFAPFVEDGLLPPPKRYVPGRWKFFCKQMLLKLSISKD
jgi:hypothetical protein